MKPTERIEHLVHLLRQRLPEVVVEVDRPERPTGSWFVDVRARDRSVVVELRSDPESGFGVSSTPTEGFGEAPDEFLEDEAATAERVITLLRSGERTIPQRRNIVRELRTRRGVSQVGLASMLGVKQPTISKLEHREDTSLSMLRRVAEVLGGVLEVRVRFSDGSVDICDGEAQQARTRRVDPARSTS